jgi:hypothetical protein
MNDADRAACERDQIAIVKELPNGEAVGLYRFLFTIAVVLIETDYAFKTSPAGGYDIGYRRRYCFERSGDAWNAAVLWDPDTEPDPPGPWVKEKSKNKQGGTYDRLNPALASEDFDNVFDRAILDRDAKRRRIN